MKRFFPVINLLAVLALALSACAPAAAPAAPEAPAAAEPAAGEAPAATEPAAEEAPASADEITITFWNSFTGSDGETLKAIVNDYNAENAGKIKVEMDIMASDVFSQKVPPSIATNTAPSLIALNVADTLAYSKQGSILDVSDFFDTPGVDKADFLPASLEIGNFDGKQYGIPMQLFNSTNLYWNKDLFEAAGLDPEQPPTTFAELEEMAIKLTDPENGQYGFGMFASAAPQWYAVMIKGNGGDIVDMESNTSVLNSEANMETFEMLHRMAFVENVSPKSTGGVAMDNIMQSGKLAMYFNGPWAIPGLESHDINYGVAPVPAGSAGRVAVLDGTLFAIPVGTDDAHKAAVYDFLKYWNSTANGKRWSLSIGFPPYLLSVINDPEIQADPNISSLAENAKDAQPWMGGLVSAGNIDANVLFPLMEALQNEGDVAEMVNKASEQIDSILENEK